MKLVWVNREKIEFHEEMERERAWLIAEMRCLCCHEYAPEYIDCTGLPICFACIEPYLREDE